MAEAQLTNQLTRIESMTNAELRAELKQRGCPTSGNKKDLLAKLRVALQKEYEQNQPTVQYHNLPIPENVYSSSVPVIPIEPINIPEKKSRTRSKKSSVDSQSNEISNSTSIQLDTSTNDNNVEMISFVSKSNEEKEKDIEKIGGELHLSSVDSSNDKSESIIKEIPLSDEQQRLKSEQQNSAIDIPNTDIKNQTEIADVKSAITEQRETVKEDEPSLINKEPEKPAPQQQLKSNRFQISSFIKSLNRSTSNKINLSIEILKTLIPDISLASESLINDEFDALINDEQSPNEINIGNDFLTIGELADQKQQTNRTVISADLSSNGDLFTRKKQNSTNNIVTDEPVRIKDATAVHEPLSQILYIRGLTRPFSLFQLKGLLSRYGTLTDGEFWLDKIKSQCFVTYNTLEEAQNAREALDGCRWPSTNPKTLSVRFGRQDEFEFSKTHDLPPEEISNDRIVQEKANVITSRRSPSPIDAPKANRSDVREWDKPKFQEEIKSGFLITDEENEPVKMNESPMKGLDDYFRKTKAKPSIYWLPLTEEEITERTRRQEQRKAERDEEQRKRESTENVRRSGSSPREKRRHSVSPSRRDSKRH